MKFLKATTTDGKTEYFNINNLLTITEEGENLKILMGAGLYWRVIRESVEMIDFSSSKRFFADMEDLKK